MKGYPRAVERFLEFARQANLPLDATDVETPVARYLLAVDSGEYPAPSSEPILARSAVRKFGLFLKSRSRT